MVQLSFIIYLEEDGATIIINLSRGGWCNYYLLIYLEEDGATIIYDPLAHNKQDRMNIEMVRS